jgi:hypothetical protein
MLPGSRGKIAGSEGSVIDGRCRWAMLHFVSD